MPQRLVLPISPARRFAIAIVAVVVTAGVGGCSAALMTRGVRERVLTCDRQEGACTIRSTTGGGDVVSVTIPLRDVRGLRFQPVNSVQGSGSNRHTAQVASALYLDVATDGAAKYLGEVSSLRPTLDDAPPELVRFFADPTVARAEHRFVTKDHPGVFLLLCACVWVILLLAGLAIVGVAKRIESDGSFVRIDDVIVGIHVRKSARLGWSSALDQLKAVSIVESTSGAAVYLQSDGSSERIAHFGDVDAARRCATEVGALLGKPVRG